MRRFLKPKAVLFTPSPTADHNTSSPSEKALTKSDPPTSITSQNLKTPTSARKRVSDEKCADGEINNQKERKSNKKPRPFTDQLFITYPWVIRKEQKLYCKYCIAFPAGVHKAEAFLNGWSGNQDGFKEEMFRRHETRHSKQGGSKQKFLEKFGQPTSLTGQSKMDISLNKLTPQLKSILCAKFVACNLIATEKICTSKFKPLLDAFEKVGVPVGTTHRSRHGFKMFCAIQASHLKSQQADRYSAESCDFFSVNFDGTTDTSGNQQEMVGIRLMDRKGNLWVDTLGIKQVDYANASNVKGAIMESLEDYGVKQQDVKKRLVGLCADGAKVNMGNYAGVKALFQKSGGSESVQQSEYLGLPWILMIHCVNHAQELAIVDYKKQFPYVEEFDSILEKLFKLYHYSSALTQGCRDLAVFLDEDFVKLSALHAIRWAASQHRALCKLDHSYPVICQHLESVAADKKHKRQAECSGLFRCITSLQFVKMLMFMLDVHDILKFLSLRFQKQELMLIEVLPLLDVVSLDLRSLRGGKDTTC